jgi:hypothetical protein
MGIDMGRFSLLLLAAACSSFSAVTGYFNQASAEQPARQPVPDVLIGPYIAEPEILETLDKAGSDGCQHAGPLHFQCLVYRDDRSKMTAEDLASNPFKIPKFKLIRSTVEKDLGSIKGERFGGPSLAKLDAGFIGLSNAKIELVGVINRMDRQFNRDIVPGHDKALACGEISAIYRFGYEGRIADDPRGVEPDSRNLTYRSRLPVTMNVVFPAIPWSGELTCAQVAERWLDYAEALRIGAPPETLKAQAALLVSSLKPEDVDRIELNMQGSRLRASDDKENTEFGTLATYIIRVFRWIPEQHIWKASWLNNQIDRARLLKKDYDDNTCEDRRGLKLDRDKLIKFLFSMDPPGTKNGTNGFGDVNLGFVNIPQEFLACRAISISPGGGSRSGNQPFWNAASPDEQIVSDTEINAALEQYKHQNPNSLYVGSADEFRTRLNEASCSGCHQTRAIAGFHFPGADKQDASPVNAVLLPGSPHFYGDQLRRMDILRLIAGGASVSFPQLVTSYASRPFNKYLELSPSHSPSKIQLIGGWGGACLTSSAPKGIRKWDCAAGLYCKSLFDSPNQPGVGVCMNPDAKPQIGDAMQIGTVKSLSFGLDKYTRIPKLFTGNQRDSRISVDWLTAPPNNSYFAAHQEYYDGDYNLDHRPETPEQKARRIRDQMTGGFPGGALRLSECINLPDEATCGMLASDGFNDCLQAVGKPGITPDTCFNLYTAYAGVRACDASSPCRDDYICLRPMRGYTVENASRLVKAYTDARKNAQLPPYFFGSKGPDRAWLTREDGGGDKRGLCVPPYFVFQFKADGHKLPRH